MPTLSDKLKSLGVKVGTQDLPPPKPRAARATVRAIESVVSGRAHATACGETFVVEATYPPEYRHGRAALPFTASLATIAAWATEPRLAQCDLGHLVFLDTETTGLAGGTGTFAFLIGLGRFVGAEFRLRQIFMRDPIEEPAALAALSEFLQPDDALVTFNGKAFDAPLLRNRCIVNRHAVPFADAAHLDLLPLARRLWRDRLESRALGSLEQHILGMARTEEDIPGWLIPQIYFDYLRSGDARELRGVFYHNAMDVVAMAALLNHIAALLNDPLTFVVEHGLDVIAIGKLFEDLGRWDEAARLYARGLELELSEESFRETVQRYAHLQRRRGDLSSAVELWRGAAGTRQVYAFVELAKYYEHRARDYAEAIAQTRAALAIVTAADFPRDARTQWLGELEHRLARLERKKDRTRTNAEERG
jgi:uncharacterized protein YprB with RNaseH-like and TPR domain